MSAPRQRGIDTLRLARWLRRSLLPLAVVLGVLLWRTYGTLYVPAGMDTMPEIPPGSLCVIEKRPRQPAPGQVVFIDLAGGTVLTRVVRVEGDRVFVQHDAEDSRLPDSDDVGPLPTTAVRALVLGSFAVEGGAPPVHGGR